MLRSIFWKPYSRLFIVGDNSGWSTDEDACDLKKIADKLRVPAEIIKRAYLNLPQAVHYTSQFSLMLPIYKSRHRISVDYYHGKPDQQESFRKCFDALQAHQKQIARVRVSNREIERLIKSAIDPAKVKLIHLGIDLDTFKPRTESSRLKVRDSLGIPEDAVVIGSFQKDGVGWQEGNEPKLIKGPDIFIEAIANLKLLSSYNLWVLLSGPARGYVKSNLEKLGIPYRHRFFKNSAEIANLYDALDLYMVSSREEGGPKAVLQSMAKGVPLITTAVGQAVDLVRHGENAMIAPIESPMALAEHAFKIISNPELKDHLIQNGLKTAQENSFEMQGNLWQEYLKLLID